MNRTKLRRRVAPVQPNKSKPAKDRKIQAIKSERRLENRSTRRQRMAISKLNQQNILDVIKCISGPANVRAPEERASEESVVYVGTTYLNFLDVPRKASAVDLTRSDASLNATLRESSNYGCDMCGGDSAFDELDLKAHPASSSGSICTIFPPKPSYLFETPSEETCACQKQCRLTQKRNLSSTDVTHAKPKRRVHSGSGYYREEIDGGSTEFVWKLKRSYPLTDGLRLNSSDSEFVNTDSDVDVEMRELVD